VRSLIQRLLPVALASVLLPTAAAAQKKQAMLGPQAGFATNSFDLLLGAQVSYEVAPRLDAYPSFDIYFPSGTGSAWSLNANVRYWPRLNMPNAGLYAGGGLGITHLSAPGFSDTKAGLNLLGGWEFRTSSLRPFVELRAVLASNVDRIEFVGGINFKL